MSPIDTMMAKLRRDDLDPRDRCATLLVLASILLTTGNNDSIAGETVAWAIAFLPDVAMSAFDKACDSIAGDISKRVSN